MLVTLEELTHLLKKKKIKIGKDEFLLSLLSQVTLNDAVLAGFLLLLAPYRCSQQNKKRRGFAKKV